MCVAAILQSHLYRLAELIKLSYSSTETVTLAFTLWLLALLLSVHFY